MAKVTRPSLTELKARAAAGSKTKVSTPRSSGFTGGSYTNPAGKSQSRTTLKRVKIQGRSASDVAKRYGVAASSIKKKGDSFILPKSASLSKGMGTRSATAIDRAASKDKQRAARYETGRTNVTKTPGSGSDKRVFAYSNQASQGGLGPANKRRTTTPPFRRGGGSKYATATPAPTKPGSKMSSKGTSGVTVKTTKSPSQVVKESGRKVTTGYGSANRPSKSGYGKTRGSRFFARTGRGKK